MALYNHCRITHGLRFHSPDEANRICGVPVHPYDDDYDYGRSIATLRSTKRRRTSTTANGITTTTANRRKSRIIKLRLHHDTARTTRRSSTPAATPLPSFLLASIDPLHCTIERIVVGQISKFIPFSQRGADTRLSHRWMIYLRAATPAPSPATDHTLLAPFIKTVKFFLHPSYKPNDVIELTQAPFRIVRYGWGEFPIRIRVEFHDHERNKPVDIIHSLALETQHTGHPVQHPERILAVHLHHQTHLLDPSHPQEHPPSTQQHPDDDKHQPEQPPCSRDQQLEIPDTYDEQFSIENNPRVLESDTTGPLPAIPEHDPTTTTTTTTAQPTLSGEVYCRFCGTHQAQTGHVSEQCLFRPLNKRHKLRNRLSTLSSPAMSLEDAQQFSRRRTESAAESGQEAELGELELTRRMKASIDSMWTNEQKLVSCFPSAFLTPPVQHKPNEHDTTTATGATATDLDQHQASDPMDATPSAPAMNECWKQLSQNPVVTWPLRAVHQLELSSFNSDTPPTAWSLISLAANNMLQALVRASLYIAQEELADVDDAAPLSTSATRTSASAQEAKSDATVMPKKRLLTPFHVFRAIYRTRREHDQFGFLTNGGMESLWHKNKPPGVSMGGTPAPSESVVSMSDGASLRNAESLPPHGHDDDDRDELPMPLGNGDGVAMVVEEVEG